MAKRKVEELSVDDLLDGKFMDVKSNNTKKKQKRLPAASLGSNAKDKTKNKGGEGRKSSEGSFQDDLQALKERDPEFYKYLKETDSGLLDFREEDTDEEKPEALGSEQEESEEDRAEQGAEVAGGDDVQEKLGDQQTLTADVLDAWCSEATKHASLRSMRKLLKAYRVACHYGDSETEVDEALRATSSAAFNKLLIFMLKEADGVFRRMLDVQSDSDLTDGSFKRTKRWQKVEPLLKSYLGNSLHLLGHAMSSGMLIFILRKLRASIPFLGSFQRLQRKYMRQAISIFSTNEAAPRVQALVFIRQMATTLPAPAMDQAVKGVYRAFVRNAKFMTPSSVPHVAFLGSCVVEIFGLDMGIAYEHAFTYIRQLAALLRSALSHKTKDAFREVYCWQTVNTLELWAKLLAAHNDKEELRPLVYPLCQVLIGAVKLVPTPRYFPLHLRLIRALINLEGATRILLPVAPLLLEMLHWSALHKPVKAGKGTPPQNVLLLRASKASLATSAFQADVVEQVMELLGAHLSHWACSVAFPELSHVPLHALRRFTKRTAVERFRSAAKGLVSALEETGSLVSGRRADASFAPKDTGATQGFMSEEDAAQNTPLHVYVASLRLKARQQAALRETGLVEATEGDADIGEAERSEEESDEDAAPEKVVLPKKKSAGKKKSVSGKPVPSEVPMQMMEFGDEDEVQEYELSD